MPFNTKNVSLIALPIVVIWTHVTARSCVADFQFEPRIQRQPRQTVMGFQHGRYLPNSTLESHETKAKR